jgi:uncharacterized protein YgiM (DUF1202 family)
MFVSGCNGIQCQKLSGAPGENSIKIAMQAASGAKLRGSKMKLKRMFLIVALMSTVALLAACQPITAEQMENALANQPVATEATAEEGAATVSDGEGALATVTARSLRVRAEPSESSEVVAGIRQGEEYEVIGRSSDGLWIELAIPQAKQGSGWVSANFVTVAGAITDTEVSSAPVATATPTEEAMATEAPAEEPVATEAATEEPVATEAPTEEPVATEAPAEEAMATEAPAEEATPVATEAPAEEATPVATEAPAEEATPVATEAPAEEPVATETPAEETAAVTPPAAGFALVTAEGARLRVRAEASTDAAIVGWVQPGETVPVVELSTDGLWVKIGPMPGTQNPDGGWVSAEFLVLGQ